MGRSMRLRFWIGLTLLVIAVPLAYLTLRPYGMYYVTSNPGCNLACGSPAALPTKCPGVLHGPPEDRDAPLGGTGVQGASTCQDGDALRVLGLAGEGTTLAVGLGLIGFEMARRRPTAPPVVADHSLTPLP